MFERNKYTGRYSRATTTEDEIAGCMAIIMLIALHLALPGAIISVLGNIVAPDMNFTLLGGMAIVWLLRTVLK